MAAAGSGMYMIPGDVLVRSGIPGQSNVILGADLDLAKAAKKKDQPFGQGYVRPWRRGVMEVPSNMVIISNHCARKLRNPAPEMLLFFDSRIAISQRKPLPSVRFDSVNNYATQFKTSIRLEVPEPFRIYLMSDVISQRYGIARTLPL